MFQSSIRNYVFNLNWCLLLIKSIKVKYKSSLNNCFFVSINMLCFFVRFFPVSYDINDVSNKLVSARVILFI